MEMKWYTIYTKADSEKKVTSILERKKIVHFCPVNTMPARLKREKNIEYFNRYVFVKTSECQISQLKQIKGVISLLYWKNKPAVINEAEIDLIKSFLKKYTNVKIEKKEIGFVATSYYVFNSQKENQGKLIDMNNNLNDNKIQVVLPSLGYTMIGEYERSAGEFALNDNMINSQKLKLKYRIAT